MINLLKGLFSDSNEDEEESIFSKSDDEVPEFPEESENKSENDWEKFSTVEDKEEKSAFEAAREEAKSNEGLKLSESVLSCYANPQDTAKVKYGLNRTGYYNDDISTIPNQKMLDGVKSFQKDNNLRIDGRLNPTGETITAINKKMKEKISLHKSQKYLNTLNEKVKSSIEPYENRVKNITNDYYKATSGEYRTRKSDIPDSWGKGTERALNNFLEEGRIALAKPDNSGIFAPFYDHTNNLDTMERLGYKGADKFFHCKAAYESSMRGKWGTKVSKALNIMREVFQQLMRDNIIDYSDDWEADKRGWNGAKKNIKLLDACSRNPRDYYK